MSDSPISSQDQQVQTQDTSALKIVLLTLASVLALVTCAVFLYKAWHLYSAPTARPGFASRVPPRPAVSIEEAFDWADLKLPRQRILSGGPPKDGIPSLTKPDTVPIAGAPFAPQHRVVGVTVNGESRAYPIAILNHHECVNDELGGAPIAVIYCPLCDSVSVVDRRLGDKTYEFGISGLLFNSNVLLYDRTDNALRSQVGLKAVSGPNAGRSLKHLNDWGIVPLEQWQKEHPNSTVLDTRTGHGRRYNANPYASYFTSDRLMFPAEPHDDRFRNKAPVVGVQSGGLLRAYPIEYLSALADGKLVDTIGESAVELHVDPDSGAVSVVQIPPGAQVVHTFWFAWAAFHPDTQVFGPPAGATTQTGGEQ